MPILKSIRQFLTPGRPVEIDAAEEAARESVEPVAPLAVEPHRIDPIDLFDRLDESIRSGRTVQDRTLEAIKGVPIAVTEVQRIAAGQSELASAIKSLETQTERRAEAESAVLDRLSDLLDRETALFGLLQNQLDDNQRAIESTASRLEEITSAIHETARTNRATGEAMEAMVSEIREREKRSEERAGVLQGWVVTCVFACLATTIAALALAWAVLGTPG